MRKRIFSALLVIVILGSFFSVPSAALVADLKDVINETTFAEYVRLDYFSKVVTAFFKGQSEDDHGQYFCSTPYAANNNVFVTESALDMLATRFNTDYGAKSKFTLTKTFLADTGYYGLRILGSEQDSFGLCWLADNAGRAILAEPDDSTKGGQWIHLNQALSAKKKKMLSREALQNLANDLNAHVMSTDSYYMITNSRGDGVYADSTGVPFAAWLNSGQAAINQPRPDTSVKDEDGKLAKDDDGNVIDASTNNNTTNIDLSGMTITLPNGDIQVADAVIYDESTKTYYIDSHDTTNYNITYNYHWEYHINYTSITYIGQTEEYNKYYEVYYELPDGRDSSDLTAEDLERLNLDIDVVNYGRYADDTSVRCLYHFDGDVQDSSYWSYRGNFKWNSGASLTYMDAGAFNGALYLDQTAHNFTVSLPTALNKGDFWLSFRYYQSATAAPKKDSYLALGGVKVLYFDGKYLYSSSDAKLAEIPTGTWNEISIVRHGNIMSYYLNGVYIGFVSSSAAVNYSSAVNFVFGNQQQTFKYFDELRILNTVAFFGNTNYTCPSVPYDTNLTLVLPDSVPVADEYAKWSVPKNIIATYDFCSGKKFWGDEVNSGLWGMNLTGSPSLTGTTFSGSHGFPRATFRPMLLFTTSAQRGKTYRIVVVYSYKGVSYCKGTDFYIKANGKGSGVCSNVGSGPLSIGWDSDNYSYLMLTIGSDYTYEKVYILPQGTALPTYELVTSVTEVPQMKAPTLAVKSSITVTAQQIGGFRPSVPKKGLVWAMVEGGVIKSLQIYNGQAWQGCDGRIFTGTRWVPYSAYNIITLKDFYDVVDASGQDFSYIYSEIGFWNWWQKSWNTFTSRFFSALDSAGLDTSGEKSLWNTIKDAFNNSLGALISAVFDLIAEVLAALLGLVTDMLSFFFGFFTDTVTGAIRSFFTSISDPALFDFFQRPPVVGPDGSESSGGYGLPDEVGTAFEFISGVIMILPAELRSIMFFAIAAMAFLGVLKLVKS